jgi:ubiquinone/menaquinone biosynthesis C-methylase UbiE
VSGEAFKAFESGAWHRRASTYDLVIGAVAARVGEELLDGVGCAPGTRLLDVGCGPGTITAAAAARGARATGIDLAAGMLALGRERHPHLQLVEGDAEALPFADGAFDALVGGFILNHLPAVDTAVAEAARVLAPGGRMAVAVWQRPERNRLLGELTAAVRDAGVPVRGGLPDGPDPYRLADPAEMEAFLAAAGAASVEARPFTLVHQAADAEELWDGLLGGTARISTVLDAQPPEVRERVRAAFIARVAPSGGRVALEAAVTIGCATFGTP